MTPPSFGLRSVRRYGARAGEFVMPNIYDNIEE